MVFAYYKADVDQIIALDADNAGGLKGRYENKQKEAVLQKRIKGLQQLLQRTRSPARVLVELEKALEEFAEEPQSALKLNLLKIEMLTYEDRHEDVLKVSDGILQVEGLEAPVRFQALVARLQSLDALKRSDEALALADKSIADFAEFPDQQITFFLAKATFQKEAGNIKEARTTVDAAKKVATPRMKTAIDRFAKAIFADVPETETPDTGKPEAPAAGDAGASEESGDAAKGDDAAKENDGAE